MRNKIISTLKYRSFPLLFIAQTSQKQTEIDFQMNTDDYILLLKLLNPQNCGNLRAK